MTKTHFKGINNKLNSVLKRSFAAFSRGIILFIPAVILISSTTVVAQELNNNERQEKEKFSIKMDKI